MSMTDAELAKWLESNHIGVSTDERGRIFRVWMAGISSGADEIMPKIAEIKTLTEFGALNLSDLSNQGIRHLADHLNVRDVGIGRCRVTGAGLEIIPTLPKLEILHIEINHANDGLQWLGQSVPLKRLSALDCGITDEALPALSHLTNLEELNLSGNPIEAGIGFISQLPKLRCLCAERTKITDETTKLIAEAKILEQLFLGDGFSDAALKNLSVLPRLNTLAINGTFTPDGLTALRRAPKLEWLSLEDTNITKGMAQSLAEWKTLRNLHVHKDRISHDDLRMLRSALPECDFCVMRYELDSSDKPPLSGN